MDKNTIEELKMKAKILSAIAGIAFIVLAASCTSVQPLCATSNAVGQKVGQATGNFLFGLPLSANYSIQSAAQNGGISQISTVDVKTYTVFGLWTSKTTIVTGN